MIKNIFWSLFKVLRILVRFFLKHEFSVPILVKYSNIKFHELRPVGAELFRAKRRTDRQT